MWIECLQRRHPLNFFRFLNFIHLGSIVLLYTLSVPSIFSIISTLYLASLHKPFQKWFDKILQCLFSDRFLKSSLTQLSPSFNFSNILQLTFITCHQIFNIRTMKTNVNSTWRCKTVISSLSNRAKSLSVGQKSD